MVDDIATNWVPESCLLPAVEQPLRVAEFDRLFTESAVRWSRVSDRSFELVLTLVDEATVRDLAAREVGCCSFFTFKFRSTGADLVMDIAVPPAQTEVLDALSERVSAAIAARRAP